MSGWDSLKENYIKELWSRGIPIEDIKGAYKEFDEEMENSAITKAREDMVDAILYYTGLVNPSNEVTKEEMLEEFKAAEARWKKVEERKTKPKNEDSIEKWLKREGLSF
jgi:hypothetical protein